MVKETNYIYRKDEKKFNLKQSLSCSDYGIYAAKCLICNHLYVGQTINKFSQRWNSHRKNWTDAINLNFRPTNLINPDEQAIYNHYKKFHPDQIQQKLELPKAFEVTFLEKPAVTNVYVAESMWAADLEAEINVAGLCLPKHR